MNFQLFFRCTYLFAYDANYFNGTMKYFFSGESWGYMAVSKRTVVGFCMGVYDQTIDRVNFRLTYRVKGEIVRMMEEPNIIRKK